MLCLRCFEPALYYRPHVFLWQPHFPSTYYIVQVVVGMMMLRRIADLLYHLLYTAERVAKFILQAGPRHSSIPCHIISGLHSRSFRIVVAFRTKSLHNRRQCPGE